MFTRAVWFPRPTIESRSKIQTLPRPRIGLHFWRPTFRQQAAISDRFQPPSQSQHTDRPRSLNSILRQQYTRFDYELCQHGHRDIIQKPLFVLKVENYTFISNNRCFDAIHRYIYIFFINIHFINLHIFFYRIV